MEKTISIKEKMRVKPVGIKQVMDRVIQFNINAILEDNDVLEAYQAAIYNLGNRDYIKANAIMDMIESHNPNTGIITKEEGAKKVAERDAIEQEKRARREHFSVIRYNK